MIIESQVVAGQALQICLSEVVYAEKQTSQLELAPVANFKLWTLFNGLDFRFDSA